MKSKPTAAQESKALPLTTAEEKSVLTDSSVKDTETDAREKNSTIDATTQDTGNGFRKTDTPQRSLSNKLCQTSLCPLS